MIKFRCKQFGFLDRLGGNTKLKDLMFKAIRGGKISKDVPSDFPEDLKRYMTFLLDNNIKGREQMSGDKGSGMVYTLYGYNSIMDQIAGKVPFGVRKTDFPRIVLIQSGSFLICYLINEKKYALYEEAASFDLISRGVNRLFGVSNKPKLVSDSLETIIRTTFASIVRVVY